MKISKLRVKADKKENILNEIFLIKDLGIEGDKKACGGDRQLALADEAELCVYRKEQNGLCANRYMPNISTEGLDYGTLSKGDKLYIGDVEIEITDIGKRCFPECPLVQSGKTCNMKRNCAFAKVVCSGKVSAGDEISL